MFGFLRRKKPDPQAAPVPAASPAADAAPETDASAHAGASAAESAAVADAARPVAPAGGAAAEQAAAAAESAAPAQPGKLAGFFGRLLGTGPEPTPEPAPAPAEAAQPAATPGTTAVPERVMPEPSAAGPTAAPEQLDAPERTAAPEITASGITASELAAAPQPADAPQPAAPEPIASQPTAVPELAALPHADAPEPVARLESAPEMAQSAAPTEPTSLAESDAATAELSPARPISLPSRFTRSARPQPAEGVVSFQPQPQPQPQPVIVEPAALPLSAQPASVLLDEPTVSIGDRSSWVARLKQGLSKTRSNLGTLFVGVQVDEALFEDLETALLLADAGVEATTYLLEQLRGTVKKERLTEGEQVRRALKRLVAELLMPLEQPIDIDRADPLVMMIAGVNGAGKTTSIGKLARHLQREQKSVLLAAGDTFRAAAREQLAQWGERNGVAVIAQQGGDPAAVAFDAVAAAQARRIEVVIVDTAGRLPTQLHLMQELKKVRRVLAKAMPDAPHETLLVLDGNTGQNALAQVKAFDDAVPLTGLVVTKLDGTAKGGALIALAHTRRDKPIPVYFIGVGEGIEDLQAFSAEEFAEALFA